jgi:hypothetical protein
MLRGVSRRSDVLLEGSKLSDESSELAFSGAQLTGHGVTTVRPTAAADQRNEPQFAPG